MYIDDAVRGILAGVDRATGLQTAFNVGSDDAILVKEIADIVVREMGLSGVAYSWTGGVAGGGWKGDVKRMVLDTTRLKATGWRPKLTSVEAVAQAVRDRLA